MSSGVNQLAFPQRRKTGNFDHPMTIYASFRFNQVSRIWEKV